jgi:oxygen-dependent protoporphyrinogen oxidase
VVDPLLGGIYAGTADRMSLAAGAPQLGGVDIDRSMFLALRRQGRQQPPPSGQPVFYTLPAGLGRLVDVLSNSLSHTEIRLGTSVQQVSTTSTGVVVDSSSGVEIFDAAVMATPAFATAAIIAGASPEGARLLASIDHASVAMVTMIVDESALGRPLDATGLLVPRPERRFVTACSWGSTKWSHWKPDGKVVLRVSAGAIDQPGVCDLDDDTIVGAVTNDLSRLMDLRGAADEVRVTRWWRSFPQYEPGHLDLADAIDAAVGADLPGIHVTGAAMRGIGIPACIRQGTEAAVAVLERGRK